MMRVYHFSRAWGAYISLLQNAALKACACIWFPITCNML
uniref:Uncharacterized protein n=1 Tax=Arundo donax TaxID=35708 RepID=A0A0A9C0L6_ARUDO